MKILAHRGLWHHLNERNSPSALELGLRAGFGLETDIREISDKLVIGHDLVTPAAPQLSSLFLLYKELGGDSPLALNIKADGLRHLLKSQLAQFSITNYFCFDMSVPETLAYQRDGLRFFTRESELERSPVLYGEAAGVWLDLFHSDWVTPSRINEHLAAKKEVALVSPELHGRLHLPFWVTLRDAGLARRSEVMLCTDHPIAAREFFND